MEVHLQEWLELSLRWAHLTVGIAWIGASFYFNWLENRLIRQQSVNPSIEGDLWAIHGGGFYHVQKYEVAPDELPAQLHWFKWEAYFTWFTGLALLALIFYGNANVYLLDQSVAQLAPWQGITIGVATLAISWIFYDLMCRSAFAERHLLLALIIFTYFCLLAILLCNTFSGRGAYIHVGSAIGTVMVLNVMAVIVPSQKSLVRAMQTGGERDAALGRAGLTRSRHNNYLTLPVLFIMISSHYPSTFSSSWNWLILIGIAVAGIVVRHYFNVRHLPGTKWWLLLVGAGIFVLIVLMTLPESRPTLDTVKSVSIENVRSVIHERCTVCHSAAPVRTEFQVAPGGIVMDTDEQINTLASRIYTTTVATRSMPIGNLSQMTEAERQLIGNWYTQLGKAAQ
ncbi:MAG: urate hydroxylase PuuD [Gammaproteobacteria bacterium]|nr:urate hydroxylase PuuD [Gammaproteobacteria bacterium]